VGSGRAKAALAAFFLSFQAHALDPGAVEKLAFGDGEGGTQLRKLIFDAGLARFFQAQQFGELGYLRIEAIEGGVFAGYFLLEVELNDHEYSQQKNDTEDQRRQRVDETRPVIHAAFTAADSCQRHGVQLNG